MAQITGMLFIDMTGAQPMFDSFRSLAEALAGIEFEGGSEHEFTSEKGVLRWQGHPLAELVLGNFEGLRASASAVPSFYLPLFVEAIRRDVPALKVEWLGGWPQFSARPHGEDPDSEPGPVLDPPLELEPA